MEHREWRLGISSSGQVTTTFLNVDLDVSGTEDLSPLVQALHPAIFELHTGRGRSGYETHLELASRASARTSDADATIKRFVKLLTVLPPRARGLWERARQRDFNIGIQGGSEPHAFELGLRPETLQAVARLGARIVVTVYAVGPEYLDWRRRRRTRRGNTR
jgi:hypothetical protein